MQSKILNSQGISRINPINDESWPSLLSEQPRRSFFHGAAWAKVLNGTYDYQPHYFGLARGKGESCWLPVMEVDSWLTGRRGISLPFTDSCEPLCEDAGTFKKLFAAAVEFGKSRNWKYLECRGGRELLKEVPASLSFYGHTLDLTAGLDKLFANLESPVRRAIRKAEKMQVMAEVLQSEEALRIFYGLQCQTRKKHGLPPQPLKFFLNIHRHILSQNTGMVVLAKHQGRAVAASIFFNAGQDAIYKFGASDEKHQDLRAANLVMWTAIKEQVRRGMTRLDLGRTSIGNEGLRKFKLGWGATEQKIEYVKFDFSKNDFVADDDLTSGWHTKIFRRMPPFMSRAAGAVLYKHWA